MIMQRMEPTTTWEPIVADLRVLRVQSVLLSLDYLVSQHIIGL